jgi:4-amino-4-deoxy-L-arabinose transferase-like glycosyltransferase
MTAPDAASVWRLPACVSVLGVFAALFFSLVIYPRIGAPLNARIDPDRLGELSKNLFEGRGFAYDKDGRVEPAFDRGPLYPALLVGVYTLSGGVSFTSVQILQAFLHGLTCWITFLIGARLYGRGPALVAQVVCAFHPMLLWYTARIWIETTHTFLITLDAYALLVLAARPTISRGLVAGILLGAASLTKSIVLPFGVIFSAWLILRRKGEGRRPGMVLLAACILVVAPWTLRNFAVGGMFVPVHTSFGLNLMQGDAIAEHWSESPLSNTRLWELGNTKKDSLLKAGGLSAIEPGGDRALVREALTFYARHPLFTVRRFFLNVLTFWYLSDSPVKSIGLAIIELPLLILAVTGGWKHRRHISQSGILVAMATYFIVVHGLIVGWARYSVPIVPLVILLAVGTLQRGSSGAANPDKPESPLKSLNGRASASL